MTQGKFQEPTDSVAEVKTLHIWLKKFLPGNHPKFDSTPKKPREIYKFDHIVQELNDGSKVAKLCGLRYFMSFEAPNGAFPAREIFERFNPKPEKLKQQVTVHFLPQPGLYPDWYRPSR